MSKKPKRVPICPTLFLTTRLPVKQNVASSPPREPSEKHFYCQSREALLNDAGGLRSLNAGLQYFEEYGAVLKLPPQGVPGK